MASATSRGSCRRRFSRPFDSPMALAQGRVGRARRVLVRSSVPAVAPGTASARGPGTATHTIPRRLTAGAPLAALHHGSAPPPHPHPLQVCLGPPASAGCRRRAPAPAATRAATRRPPAPAAPPCTQCAAPAAQAGAWRGGRGGRAAPQRNAGSQAGHGRGTRTCSVCPPSMAPRNSPSGLSACRHCMITPCARHGGKGRRGGAAQRSEVQAGAAASALGGQWMRLVHGDV